MNKLSDIQEAFHFVSGAPPGMHTAIICKDTGEIRYRSEEADLDEIGEEASSLNRRYPTTMSAFGRSSASGAPIVVSGNFWNPRVCSIDGMISRINAWNRPCGNG